MSKKIYIGVGGIARNVPNLYVGVNGVARKVKRGYIGINGVARLFYDGGKPTLPSAYQLLEYIDFSASAGGMLDSGITAYYTREITVNAQPLSSSDECVVLGCRHLTTGATRAANCIRNQSIH